MAFVTYKITYTDPKKASFNIQPNTTDGPERPTRSKLANDSTMMNTSLLLYGQGTPNYGERIGENLVNMLEHFAGPKSPVNPINGQLWWQTGNSVVVNSSNTSTNSIKLVGNLTSLLPDGTNFNVIEYSGDDDYTVNTLTVLGTPTFSGGLTTVFVTQNITAAYSSGAYATIDKPEHRFKVYDADAAGWITVAGCSYTGTGPSIFEVAKRGDIWFDDTVPATPSIKVYNGSSWVDVHGEYLGLTTGGTVQGNVVFNGSITSDNAFLDFGANLVNNLESITFEYPLTVGNEQYAVNVEYVEDAVTYALNNAGTSSFLSLNGGTLTGDVQFDVNGTALGLNWFDTVDTDIIFDMHVDITTSPGNKIFTLEATSLATATDYYSIVHDSATSGVIVNFLSDEIVSFVPVTLPGDPTDPLHSSTKQYTESYANSINNTTDATHITNTIDERTDNSSLALYNQTTVRSAINTLDSDKLKAVNGIMSGYPQAVFECPVYEITAVDTIKVNVDATPNAIFNVVPGLHVQLKDTHLNANNDVYRVVSSTFVAGTPNVNDVVLELYDGSAPTLALSSASYSYQDVTLSNGTLVSQDPNLSSVMYRVSLFLDGVLTDIDVDGSTITTYTDLITDLSLTSGLTVTFETDVVDNLEALRFASDTLGTTSSVSLVNDFLNDKFFQLINLDAAPSGATGLLNDATVYSFDVEVDGTSAVTVSVVGSNVQTYTTLISELNAQLIEIGALIKTNPSYPNSLLVETNSELLLFGGDISITSDSLFVALNSTTGVAEYVNIASPLLLSLNDVQYVSDQVSAMGGNVVTGIIGTQPTDVASVAHVDNSTRRVRTTEVVGTPTVDDIYIVPEYTIGFEELMLFQDGSLLERGIHYEEVEDGASGSPAPVGTVGVVSSSIQMLGTVPVGGERLSAVVSNRRYSTVPFR